MFWTSALLLGFAGSLHCGIMCGPIVLATSQINSTPPAVLIFRQLAYNMGRIITYALIGALVGLIGEGLHLVGIQQSLSILSGVIIFTLYFAPKVYHKFSSNNSYFTAIAKILRKKLGPLLGSQTLLSKFLIGFINGFLPCGLVYIASAAAIGIGSLGGAISFMCLFGIGTVPMLFGVSIFRTFIHRVQSLRPTRVIPFFVASISILFVLRGLNLGIPYISPLLPSEEKKEITICR